MIDPKYLRIDAPLLKESERRRFKDTGKIDEAFELDEKWRESNSVMQNQQTELNKIQKELDKIIKSMKTNIRKNKGVNNNKKKKENENEENEEGRKIVEEEIKNMVKDEIEKKKDLSEETLKIKNLKKEIEKHKKETDDLLKRRDKFIIEISNIVHANVPVSKDVKDRQIYKENKKDLVEIKYKRKYNEIDEKVNNYIINNSENKLGLKGCLVEFLEKFCSEKNYKREVSTNNFDLGCSLFFNFKEKSFPPSQLPQKYYTITNHQEKDILEKMIIGSKEESWKLMYQQLDEIEEFLKLTGLKFRISKEISAHLEKHSSFKFIIESFFPSENSFKEIGYLSNTTDYCSRYLNSKSLLIHSGNGIVKPFVHFIFSHFDIGAFSNSVLEQFQGENSFDLPQNLFSFSKLTQVPL